MCSFFFFLKPLRCIIDRESLITRSRDHRQILIVNFPLAIFPLDSKPCPYIGGYYTQQIIHNYTYTYIYICSGSTRFSQVFLRGESFFRKRMRMFSLLYIYLLFVDLFHLVSNRFPFPFVDQLSRLSVFVWPFISHRARLIIFH